MRHSVTALNDAIAVRQSPPRQSHRNTHNWTGTFSLDDAR